MNVCISFLSKDGINLTKRSLPALVQTAFDTFWIDGSRTEEGRAFLLPGGYPVKKIYQDVRGGPDAAIVFALTEMLKAGYAYVGLCEQDVQLPMDWFGSTFSLFQRGRSEGLVVGAVSPRCYEDRLLVQRDGYGLCHNLGAGVVMFSREAAQIILANYRTAWAPDNRLIFSQLSGIDIGKFWAFRGGEHWLSGDWNFDAILARHGLASLALTPSLATMLDQDIAAQDLKMADGDHPFLRSDEAFDRFWAQTKAIRHGKMLPGISGRMAFNQGGYTIFPHQIVGIGGQFCGDWTLHWMQGFGPFIWEAAGISEIEIPVLGSCEVMVSGGKLGGMVLVKDSFSGYRVEPALAPEGEQSQIMTLPIPGGCTYQHIKITCGKGTRFYGLRTIQPQPWLLNTKFDWSKLPEAR